MQRKDRQHAIDIVARSRSSRARLQHRCSAFCTKRTEFSTHVNCFKVIITRIMLLQEKTLCVFMCKIGLFACLVYRASRIILGNVFSFGEGKIHANPKYRSTTIPSTNSLCILLLVPCHDIVVANVSAEAIQSTSNCQINFALSQFLHSVEVRNLLYSTSICYGNRRIFAQ